MYDFESTAETTDPPHPLRSDGLVSSESEAGARASVGNGEGQVVDVAQLVLLEWEILSDHLVFDLHSTAQMSIMYDLRLAYMMEVSTIMLCMASHDGQWHVIASF